MSLHVKADKCSPNRCFIPTWSPYCGIPLCGQISYIFILTSEEIYRKLSHTANDSKHIYSIYHLLMIAQSSTELYPRPLVGFLLTKRDIKKYRRPFADMSLSEHVITSDRRWRVSAGGGDKCVSILSQRLSCNRIYDRAITLYLIPYITTSFVLSMLRLFTFNVWITW